MDANVVAQFPALVKLVPSPDVATPQFVVVTVKSLEGRPIEGAAVEELAKLPAADVLRAQVLGAITSPLTAIVGLFTAPLQELYGLLDARIEQLGGAEADTEPPVPESGPGEGAPGEPGGSPAPTEAPPTSEAATDTEAQAEDTHTEEATDEPETAEEEQ